MIIQAVSSRGYSQSHFTGGVYQVEKTQRLEAFEKMLQNIQKEHDSIQRQIDDLKEKGKT